MKFAVPQAQDALRRQMAIRFREEKQTGAQRALRAGRIQPQ
jgi:hypothetical protein